MNKKILSVLSAAVMFVVFAVCGTFASAEGLSRLCDYCGVLTESEAAEVSDKLDSISIMRGVDIIVVTDTDTGVSAMTYADNFGDYKGYSSDIILLFVDPESRDWYVSTRGYGITAVTDAGLDAMESKFRPYLSDGDYYTAFMTFADLCDDYINQAVSDVPYDVGNLPKESFNFVMIPISFLIGAVIALIVCLIMRAQLKSVRAKESAVDYIRRGSFRVTRSHDIFLYSKLDRREKPKDNGGGSSTHTSSSGATHGGGGGKF